MFFIGDVHGDIDTYKSLLRDMDYSIQVGDLGIGFPLVPDLDLVHKNHKFIRGNHDNPDVARNHPNYLGDYGYIKEAELFYISGAWSIDAQYRAPGITWWTDEQLSTEEFGKARKLFIKTKPKIVVSHDGPEDIAGDIILERSPFKGMGIIKNRTMSELNIMLSFHKPDIWIFGHHHTNYRKKLDKTDFICLDIMEVFEIKGLKF